MLCRVARICRLTLRVHCGLQAHRSPSSRVRVRSADAQLHLADVSIGRSEPTAPLRTRGGTLASHRSQLPLLDLLLDVAGRWVCLLYMTDLLRGLLKLCRDLGNLQSC